MVESDNLRYTKIALSRRFPLAEKLGQGIPNWGGQNPTPNSGRAGLACVTQSRGSMAWRSSGLSNLGANPSAFGRRFSESRHPDSRPSTLRLAPRDGTPAGWRTSSEPPRLELRSRKPPSEALAGIAERAESP
jgi:hypothetical protein